MKLKSAYSEHPGGHYVAQLKKLWRRHFWNLQKLCQNIEHNSGSDIILWYMAIKFMGQYNKGSISLGQSVLLATILHSTVDAIVPEGTSIEAADQNWSCEKIIPSVIGKFI